jgi:hypothetical protein
MGDFNAQLGTEDEKMNSNTQIGKILHHKKSNENGRHLRILINNCNLKAMNTKLNNSLQTTWTNATFLSQIDHILLPITSELFIKNMFATWL